MPRSLVSLCAAFIVAFLNSASVSSVMVMTVDAAMSHALDVGPDNRDVTGDSQPTTEIQMRPRSGSARATRMFLTLNLDGIKRVISCKDHSQSRRRMCGFQSNRRDWLHRKLEKLMEKIENEDLPMYIKEVYLFGSFLKGKLNPRDIDILLIYDSDRTAKKYEYIDKKGRPRWRMTALRKSPSRLRARLKKNAERTVDLSICPSLEEFKKDLTKELDCCLKIWGETDRDWKTKLNDYFLRDRKVD